MTKFNSYARELDKSVKTYFSKYRSAEAKLQKINAEIEDAQQEVREAEIARDDERMWLGRSRLAALQVEKRHASDDFDAIKKSNREVFDNIKEIRSRLEADCNKSFALDPDALDANFFALLNSGLVKPADFEALWSKAEKAGNITMQRLVADAAGHAAEAAHNKGDREDAKRLNAISSMGHNVTTGAMLERFDELVSVTRYAIGNPDAQDSRRSVPNEYFFDRWDEIAGGAIKDF